MLHLCRFWTYQRWEIDLRKVDIYAPLVCWIGWLPTDISKNSQLEVYAACPLRTSQNTNKSAICQIQSRFICKHVMQRQEKIILLPCSCKVGEKLLCSRTYSGITRNRPARLGLLCLVHPGVRNKRRVFEIDLSQPRHETAFWWRNNGPVTSQLTDPIKWPNYPLQLIGIFVHTITYKKESPQQRCRRSTNTTVFDIFVHISIWFES